MLLRSHAHDGPYERPRGGSDGVMPGSQRAVGTSRSQSSRALSQACCEIRAPFGRSAHPPARHTLARKSERNEYRTMLFGGIVLVGLVVALTIWLAATGWSMPAASGALVFAGGVAIVRGAQGLLKLRRTAR